MELLLVSFLTGAASACFIMASLKTYRTRQRAIARFDTACDQIMKGVREHGLAPDAVTASHIPDNQVESP